jgi:DNA-binding NarL/FixJ family response regulator
MAEMAHSVLIVDDHQPFRARARTLLEDDGFCVVGEAADGEAAVAAARRLKPEIVLLDVQLPDLDGFAVAERMAGEPDPPAVVLISSRSAGAYRRRLEVSPVRGFIAKAEFSGECLLALLA